IGKRIQEMGPGPRIWGFLTQNFGGFGSQTPNLGILTQIWVFPPQGSEGEESEEDSEGGEGRLCPPHDPVLAQAGRVRAGLRALELKLAALEQHQELVLGTPLPTAELQQDLQRLRDEIQELTREIRAGLRG
ncbi:STX4 protein, partial [Pomatostomus ruficeps]|nr:STX4 protein [Pomatostomus ruficeps]